jgi:hypothetical protein
MRRADFISSLLLVCWQLTRYSKADYDFAGASARRTRDFINVIVWKAATMLVDGNHPAFASFAPAYVASGKRQKFRAVIFAGKLAQLLSVCL